MSHNTEPSKDKLSEIYLELSAEITRTFLNRGMNIDRAFPCLIANVTANLCMMTEDEEHIKEVVTQSCEKGIEVYKDHKANNA